MSNGRREPIKATRLPVFKSFKEFTQMKDVEAKIKDVEARNAKVNEDIKVLGEKRAEIDRQIQGLRDEAIRQQGEYKALVDMRDAEPDASETVN